MQGVNLFYTPAMYGGGKDKGCPLLEQAMEKFGTFEPESSIAPEWGEEHCVMMIKECSAEEE